MQKETLGKKIQKARKEKGYSQGDLASLLGTKRSNISRIESDKQNVSFFMVSEIASALDMGIQIDFVNIEKTKYILKQYDTPLLSFTMITDKLEGLKISNIKIIGEKKLLPLDLIANNQGLSDWLKKRVIPKNRDHVNEILQSLGLTINDTKGIIDVCKGLSLNDSYWICDEDFKGSYKQYNLYENHFNNVLALIAYTGIYNTKRAFTTSPELTTHGMLPKAWRFIDNDGIYLYKSGTSGASNSGREPYIEYYASQIAKAMGLNCIDYDIENWKGILASKCRLFTDINTSYIPIGRIVKTGGIKKVLSYYDSLGKDFSNQIRDMLVFDALIFNEDRHFGNFGVLIDNKTNEIIKPAPIFDNGLSLLCYHAKNNTSYNQLFEYSKTRISSYGTSFDDLYSEVVTTRQKNKLKKLIGFKFKRHQKYNLSEKYLTNMEKLIQNRIQYLLKIK